jgi:hypothetical protein
LVTPGDRIVTGAEAIALLEAVARSHARDQERVKAGELKPSDLHFIPQNISNEGVAVSKTDVRQAEEAADRPSRSMRDRFRLCRVWARPLSRLWGRDSGYAGDFRPGPPAQEEEGEIPAGKVVPAQLERQLVGTDTCKWSSSCKKILIRRLFALNQQRGSIQIDS